ncbi:uncharacterized protein K452DRAFT_314180 [Aplosporella prunicola CBS 121167]|uniref:Heterokaryon incompatibility domain-containing protein n=1 Tax=Aplosporella prunicola CBS 121167 TaxID=1176127 RepID=A0A6A6AWK7_9PEZI|nr:uncharacterized protein K452DRAFT_314180 [Aplosporella prunicola CBS 121167]KAF2135187.1 hypothetical protein K452DRAFT_314180 [Aplosporella prunicola CBS 121167]
MCSLMWLIIRKSNSSLLESAMKHNKELITHDDHTYNKDANIDNEAISNKRLGLSIELSSKPSLSGTASLILMFRIRYSPAMKPAYHETIEEKLLLFTNLVPDSTKDPRIATDPRLERSGKFALMRKWLSKIPSPGPESPKFLPTRLLHVLGPDRLELIHTAEHFPLTWGFNRRAVRYVALSHKWGASQHFTTTVSTMSERCSGISIRKDLPATFRDAVEVVSQLGYSYLWIDALCIIQDDEQDWAKESGKMADVYGNAHFTIAVHCARDDTEGFLDRSMAKRTAVEFQGPDSTYYICRPANLEADVTDSQLCRRGWVLQERFLASNTIHFTEGQIYLETMHGTEAEDGPLSHHRPLMSDTANRLERSGARTILRVKNAPVAPRRKFFAPSAAPELCQLLRVPSQKYGTPTTDNTFLRTETPADWLDLITMYSNCSLTKEKDKLIALSGMAQRIHEKTGATYCAGLWHDRISEGLLWLRESTPLSTPSSPRAPSWSWAAYDGPIQFATDERSLSKTSDPFGITGPGRQHRWTQPSSPPPFSPAEPHHRPSASRCLTTKCEFIKVRDPFDLDGKDQHAWLSGPGHLELRLETTALESVQLSTSTTEIGPGPRRNIPWNLKSRLPVLKPKRFVPVRTLALRREGGERAETVVGWVSLDMEDGVGLWDARAGSRRLHGFCFASICFYQRAREGIFLVRVNESPDLYRRIGYGEVLDDSPASRWRLKNISLV